MHGYKHGAIGGLDLPEGRELKEDARIMDATCSLVSPFWKPIKPIDYRNPILNRLSLCISYLSFSKRFSIAGINRANVSSYSITTNPSNVLRNYLPKLKTPV